jgi:RNA polymerase sigma-70 factor (ECF subfamily)
VGVSEASKERLAAISGFGGSAATASSIPVSFEEFYATTWPDLAGFAAALVGSATAGDEIAQEAFVRLYARFLLVREPRPYVFRIASNLARRHNGRRQETSLARLPELIAPGMGLDPSVLDAVDRLPPRLRVVVLLHYYADLPVNEVARTVRRPVGSVKRQLSEARAVLAITLGDST